VYWLKVFEIPEAGRTAKGKSINTLISKTPDETIASFIAVKEFDDKHFVFMVTKEGLVKKVVLSEFSNPRKSGIVGANLKGKDVLTDVKLTDGTQDIIIGTRNGIAIRFHEDEIRAMGRAAAGVRGIKLGKLDVVVGMVNLRRKGTSILIATEKGFGKRSDEREYRISHRGGKGIITVKTSEKAGRMVVIKEVVESDDVVVVTAGGMVIRQHASDIRLAGRNTQGVRLIRLTENDMVADVAAVVAEDEEEKRLAEHENGNRTKPKAPPAIPEATETEGDQPNLFEDGKKKALKKGAMEKKEAEKKPAAKTVAPQKKKESKQKATHTVRPASKKSSKPAKKAKPTNQKKKK
jgi:DNA gyrase subunit A